MFPHKLLYFSFGIHFPHHHPQCNTGDVDGTAEREQKVEAEEGKLVGENQGGVKTHHGW